jgi:hypothetical protein
MKSYLIQKKEKYTTIMVKKAFEKVEEWTLILFLLWEWEEDKVKR